MDSDLNKIKNEIYELGEVEREAERIAQFHRHGGLIYRFLMWGAKQMRQDREELIQIRDEIIAEKSAAGGE